MPDHDQTPEETFRKCLFKRGFWLSIAAVAGQREDAFIYFGLGSFAFEGYVYELTKIAFKIFRFI